MVKYMHKMLVSLDKTGVIAYDSRLVYDIEMMREDIRNLNLYNFKPVTNYQSYFDLKNRDKKLKLK